MAKKEKVKKTPKQRLKVFLKVIGIIICVIAILAAIIAVANVIAVKSLNNFISTIKPVETRNITLTQDHDEYYTFVTDDELKVMQLTDIHIGGGFLSAKKDNMAINAVEAMIREEKPDLVVVTGDIAFPVPYSSGTLNNKNPAKVFASLMENLGVNWCIAFGNHDTESYSYFTREDISAEIYSDHEKYPHCLFQRGPAEVDGEGNYLIKVKNNAGEIVQGIFVMDTHSYVDGDYLGIMWKYDTIHQNQIDWYENQVKMLTEENHGQVPKSILFHHIPLRNAKEAYDEYADNSFSDTENTKFLFGNVGESGKVVFSSDYDNGMFAKILELGSTQAVYFGHDHLNTFSLEYKGVQLSYGHSVDYLAYAGISKIGSQRGCTIITICDNSTVSTKLENYYQDKYKTINEKETVSMDN